MWPFFKRTRRDCSAPPAVLATVFSTLTNTFKPCATVASPSSAASIRPSRKNVCASCCVASNPSSYAPPGHLRACAFWPIGNAHSTPDAYCFSPHFPPLNAVPPSPPPPVATNLSPHYPMKFSSHTPRREAKCSGLPEKPKPGAFRFQLVNGLFDNELNLNFAITSPKSYPASRRFASTAPPVPRSAGSKPL